VGPVTINAAWASFQAVLAEMGVDVERPDPRMTWEAFKRFATVPVATASDGLLFESLGTPVKGSATQFVVQFVRQYEVVYEDGDHDHYVQMRCEFIYALTSQLRELSRPLAMWRFANEAQSVERWIAEVESRDEFRVVMEHKPLRAEIQQHDV
jgi:hypothetical protein